MGGTEPEMLCKDIYIFMLTKDEKINISTGALYVLNEPMMHAAAVTQLQITFTTLAVKQFGPYVTAYICSCTYVKSNDHTCHMT
jgi:hypothetical protein